jgi:HK97 family phage prohead protease
MTILHKSIELNLKKAPDDAGRFSGYGSVFNVVDKGGDIVAPGAFAESLETWRKNGRTVPVLWQHDPGQPIGAWEDLKEDDYGLLGDAALWLEDAPYARLAHRGMKSNTITGLSIGYRVKKYSINQDTKVYTLEKLDLVEISVVTNPMNDDARVSDVKSLLEAGRLPTVREFEEFLRDAGGFSKSQAVAIANGGLSKLLSRGEPGGEKGDEIKRALLDILTGATKKLTP